MAIRLLQEQMSHDLKIDKKPLRQVGGEVEVKDVRSKFRVGLGCK